MRATILGCGTAVNNEKTADPEEPKRIALWGPIISPTLPKNIMKEPRVKAYADNVQEAVVDETLNICSIEYSVVIAPVTLKLSIVNPNKTRKYTTCFFRYLSGTIVRPL